MGRKIYITTDADVLNLGKISKNGVEEYIILHKGQVLEIDENNLNDIITVYLANGNLREIDPPKKKRTESKKDSKKV